MMAFVSKFIFREILTSPTQFNFIKRISIIGSGSMGSGIAQLGEARLPTTILPVLFARHWSDDVKVSQGYVVKLRGIPYSTTKNDIIDFLKVCNIKNGEEDIHFTYNSRGLPTGLAYVELQTQEDVDEALKQNRNYIGRRYIEVFRAEKSEIVVKRDNQTSQKLEKPRARYVSKTGHSICLRGLPFSATEDDILEFLSPVKPVSCELRYRNNGKPTGEANADFVSHQEALEAMKKHLSYMKVKDQDTIKERYIELFLDSEPPQTSEDKFESN